MGNLKIKGEYKGGMMLGTILSNNHELRYVTSSGALGYDGGGWPHEQPLRLLGLLDPKLFTHITKTLTYAPQRGELRWYNPFRCIRIYPDGVLNAVKLTNPGIEWFCRHIGPQIDKNKNAVIVSITADSSIHLCRMAKLLDAFDIAAIQFNPHCPNLPNQGTRTRNLYSSIEAIASNTRHPVILTLPPSIREESIARLYGMIEAITINSTEYWMTNQRDQSPLAHFGGGSVSGKRAQPFTWNYALRLMERSRIPIGFPVWTYRDLETIPRLIERFVNRSEQKSYFYTFGSVFIPYPWRPTLMARRHKKIWHHD